MNYEAPSKISESDNVLLMKVKKAFEDDKVYLNPNLTIDSFAREIGTNKTTLSHIINENLGCNFPTLLNNYRIDEAVNIFNNKEKTNLTLDAIAEMCGFNSRQVFHKAFKKRTGVPPRRFRDKNA